MNAFPMTAEPTADALAVAPLLNCLVRELAEPAGALPGGPRSALGSVPRDGHRTYRLPACGKLLRVSAGHRPGAPEVWAQSSWQPLSHAALVALVTEEMSLSTGRPNDSLAGEMAESHAAVAAILAARATATPPADPWLRSEQALVTGHPFHPAPKARGGAPAGTWLRYAPEAHASFPLVLLGVREDVLAEEGDTTALDALGPVPAGYRLLPAHPWQLALAGHLPELHDAFAQGRLIRLGETSWPVWPTASVRTVHVPRGRSLPGEDLFLKFSLDVRITNDIRRLWRHDLLTVRRTDRAVAVAFEALEGPAAWMSDLGYRTVEGLFEPCAVLVREGLDRHLLPGTTALLPAAIAEGFEGNPLDGLSDPAAWWEAYLRCVVPPVLEVFDRHGLVLECHLQNTLVAVAPDGLPVQAVFRDPEGVKLLAETGRQAGWQRLVYCLVVNHLAEIAGALADRFPGAAPALWAAVRREFERYDARRPLPEIAGLLRGATLPGKANLLLRWTDADGADSRYLPLPNPLREAGDGPY
ncbi:IucA/IucC family protein [Streptomyces sp. NPDC089919]|uniref:IucA/IucC family protein n=1 Tax=Streptomyces sp. NPDC089919 TaxID=3155188 RepID=UPI00344905BD